MTVRLWVASALVAGGLLLGAEAFACPGQVFCEVPGGRYLALPPLSWDGRHPLPATIFFHGWQSDADAFAWDPSFTAAFGREGVMLVLPDGIDKTWAHQGPPSHARDEIAFMDAVRADMLARWPIDPSEILVTGFSQGGSMVWDLACRRAYDYKAFVAVSGAFWEPLLTHCDGGPVDLLHIHGTADRTVPMAGQPIGEHWRQGDVLQGLQVLRELDGCPTKPSQTSDVAGLACQTWGDCSSGRELQLCEHGGGHLMPRGWVAFAHAWARRLHSRAQGG